MADRSVVSLSFTASFLVLLPLLFVCFVHQVSAWLTRSTITFWLHSPLHHHGWHTLARDRIRPSHTRDVCLCDGKSSPSPTYKRDHVQRRTMEPGKVTGGVEGFVDVDRPSPLPVCGYSVSRRLIRHAVDNTLCALFGLLLSPLRWLLDLIGLPRPLRYSLYGVAVFLAAVYGLSLITLALRTYLVQATVAFAAFHCFVLAASLRHA